MLTGQMDMYEEPAGYGADEQKATEQELYTWFCNWLNGMDFANMSEMERAHAVWDAMTTVSLAKALGLKSSASGDPTRHHAWCYVRVDGKIYESNNGYMPLDTPITNMQYMEDPNYVWSSDY